MKPIYALLFVLCSNSAFAFDMECSRRVSPERIEGGRISTWPHIWVETSFHECKKSGDMEMCVGGMSDLIANDQSVCFRAVDVNQDCVVNEGDSSLDINCANNVSMGFSVDSNSMGKITCMENGRLRKTWDIGLCSKK
jgi:hypothetical protein